MTKKAQNNEGLSALGSDNPTAGFPLLGTIDTPADLRALPLEKLPQVCDEIRRFLVGELSHNPGHFGSSMGAVELTVALHYVFDTPRDRLVWDVGHQAYGHKLLTGRRDNFHTNRTFGGLSGFPSPEESEYDTFTAGHASNSISVALGFAVASRLKGETPRRHVAAIIGDASISGGLAFEGINNAANTPNDLLIVLNDNDMSIDRNVGSLHSYLNRIHTSKSYNSVRFTAYKAMKKMGLVNDRGRGTITRFSNSLKAVIANEQNLFEGLNIRYFGPFDGHDVIRLVKVLIGIKDMSGPKILHLRTVKGKGFEAAEQNPAAWHAPGKFNPETGERISSKTGNPKFQDVFGGKITEMARRHTDIIGITAAMPTGTSLSVMQSEMPDRVFDVGISEGHAVTFAGGMAKEGLRPVVAIYSSFLQRAYDNIIHDVAIQRLPVIFAIDRAGLVGEDGVTHHGSLDVAYLRAVPNMTIAAPRDGAMLRALLDTAYNHASGPVAVRYPRGAAPDLTEVVEVPERIEPGVSQLVREGTDIALLALGPMVGEAVKAADTLAAEGISAAVYDMIFAKPVDTALLDRLIERAVPVITVEDGTVDGGIGSAVADYMMQRQANMPFAKIGIPDRFVTHGTIAQLRRLCGMDSDSIAEKARQLTGRTANP